MVYVRVSFLKDSKKAVLLYRKKPDPKFDKTVSKKKNLRVDFHDYVYTNQMFCIQQLTAAGMQKQYVTLGTWPAYLLRFSDVCFVFITIIFFLFLALNPIYFH